MSGKPAMLTAEEAAKEGNLERTALYRHYDESRRLLYVGISLSALTRLEQHKAASEWYGEISAITIEYFNTRAEAIAAETNAIQTERPLHNVAMTERAAEIRKMRAEESRIETLKRVVGFQPVYKIQEAAEILKVGPAAVRMLIDTGRLGHVIIHNGRRVTGWQIIDYIESLIMKSEVAE